MGHRRGDWRFAVIDDMQYYFKSIGDDARSSIISRMQVRYASLFSPALLIDFIRAIFMPGAKELGERRRLALARSIFGHWPSAAGAARSRHFTHFDFYTGAHDRCWQEARARAGGRRLAHHFSPSTDEPRLGGIVILMMRADADHALADYFADSMAGMTAFLARSPILFSSVARQAYEAPIFGITLRDAGHLR